MKNVAIILPNFRSGGSERFASRLSALLSEKYKVYIIVFEKERQDFKFSGELIDLKLPAEKGFLKRVLTLFRRAARIRKTVREKNICTAFSFTNAPNNALSFSQAKCKNTFRAEDSSICLKTPVFTAVPLNWAAIFFLTLKRCVNITEIFILATKTSCSPHTIYLTQPPSPPLQRRSLTVTTNIFLNHTR